jgi:uncharacterized protein (DUF1499 family)
MTPLAWIIGWFLPACAAAGALGLPHPALMDMGRLQRPTSPNTALAAPAGTTPAPDIVTPRYAVPAPVLFVGLRAMADAQPRTFLAAEYLAAGQVHYVVRSALFNFPDLVTAQVTAAGPDASTLVLYSRSVYGHSDLGVNRARVTTWLAALDRTLNSANER